MPPINDNCWRHSPGPGFTWIDSPVGPTLSCVTLSALAPHVFTTRQLEFRTGTIDDDYTLLAGLFAVSPEKVARVRQVHGRDVCMLGPGDDVPLQGVEAADAIVSMIPGVVASVRIADCVPVLIADRHRRVVAAVHAGWRGTVAGVVAEAIRAIRSAGVASADLVAAIGPCICPCCYQVDAVVHDALRAAWPQADGWLRADGPGHWRLDLAAATRDQLVEEGVAPDSIATAGLCTADHLDVFFSHRREGERAGRLVAAIGL